MRLDIADVLGEGPLVAFRVGGLVEAITPRLILELCDDRGAGGPGALVVRIDVVDIDVQHAADSLAGAVAVDGWRADGEQTVGNFYLGAANRAVWERMSRRGPLVKLESSAQPV